MFLLTSAAAFRLSAQQYTNLHVAPETAKPGDALSIRYNASGTPLDTVKQVACIAYLFQNTDYKWHAKDVALRQEGKHWIASIPTDTNTAFVAYKFYSDTLMDNNKDSTYTTFMHIPERHINARGCLIAWDFLRAPKLGRMIPGYISKNTISDTAAYYWFEQEFRYHGEASQKHLVLPYVQALHNYLGDKAVDKIKRVLGYLQSLKTEEALVQARTIYKDILRDSVALDSIDRTFMRQYPQGQLAKLEAYNALQKESDVNKRLVKTVEFLQDFPSDTRFADFEAANRVNYNNLYQFLVIMHVMKQDYGVYDQYINEIPFESLAQLYYKTIDIMHHRKDVTDSVLYPYSKMLIDRMDYFREHQPDTYVYLAPSEWRKQIDSYLSVTFLLTHTSICVKLQKNEEALAYARRSQTQFGFERAELNNYLAVLFDRLGDNEQLDVVLEKSFAQNQASTEMLDLLKKRYQEEKGTLDGFETYVNALKGTGNTAKELEELKAEMIKKTMPAWTMRDLEGNLISSAQLKGKIIVLDFWASWCVPCKASFPGMKLAVEKYANDPDVQFFFVDTEERGDSYKEQAAAYIKENDYPFQVVFDNRLEGNKTNSEVYKKICQAFGISGIPQKLFIDKEGKVRFISVGFKGSATALADEISAMVELTKTAK